MEVKPAAVIAAIRKTALKTIKIPVRVTTLVHSEENNNEGLVLETRRIRLRKIQKADLPILFQWRNTEKFRCLYHYDETIIDYKKFCREFKRDLGFKQFQYLVVKKDTDEPIGVTFIYFYSKKYQSCFLNLFLSEPFEKKGYGIDVFVLLSLYLFNQLDLKKLFTQVYDYNRHSISCLRKMGLRELTGNIEKKIHQGKVHDILCFAADTGLVPKLKTMNRFLSRPIEILNQ